MKRCIALAGGGAKGSYQLGFWKALRELGIDYDMTCGTSVGALNAALMAQGDYDVSDRMWHTIVTSDIVSKEPSQLSRLFDTDPLAKSLRPIWGDFSDDAVNVRMDPAPLKNLLSEVVSEEKIRLGGKELGIMTTEYPVLKAAPFILSDIEKGSLVDYLVASACVFPSMDARNIGGKRYIDGGYADNCPINLALDMGADEIISCELNGGGVKVKYDTLKAVKTIRPHFPLGPTMEFSPETAEKNILLGYQDTMREFGKYDGHWYTFEKGEREHFLRDYSWAYASLFAEIGAIKQKEISKYYEHSGIKKFAEICEERPGRMRYDFPLMAAEYAGDKFFVDPHEVFIEEVFSEKVLEKFGPYEFGWKNVKTIFDKNASIGVRANLLKNVDPREVISYMVHKLAEYKSGESDENIIRLIMRLAPGEFFAGVYIAKLKGII